MLIFAIQNHGFWIIDCHFGVVVGVKTQQLPTLCFTPLLAGRERAGTPQEAPRRPPRGTKRPPSVRLCECERDLPSSLAIIIRKHFANQEWVVVHRPSSMLWGGVFCTVGFEISIFATLKAPLARTTGLADQESTDLRKCEIFSNPNGEGGSRFDLIHQTVIEFSP